MALRRIGFVLPGLGISGGVNVVLNWGVILARAGWRVDLIVAPPPGVAPAAVVPPRLPFLPESEAGRFHVLTWAEARRARYDVAVATWWSTLADVADLEADRLAWMLQACEAQFNPAPGPDQADYLELARAGVNVIAIAPWLRRHALAHFGADPARTFCVLNGLDRALWRPRPRAPLAGRRVAFLVEGPTTDPRKNVAGTLRLLDRLGLEHRWVGSVVDRSWAGPHCRSIEERVPYDRMPEVYAGADVLVKASAAEGMFGPPLEMFATGGTAAAWHVQGAEEYMSDGHNGRLVPLGSWSALGEALLELDGDPARVRALQEHALATAEAWPSWDELAGPIRATVEALAPVDRRALVRHAAHVQFRARLVELAPPEPAGRAWRVVKALRRARRACAPDGSWRWRCVLGSARLARRTAGAAAALARPPPRGAVATSPG